MCCNHPEAFSSEPWPEKNGKRCMFIQGWKAGKPWKTYTLLRLRLTKLFTMLVYVMTSGERLMSRISCRSLTFVPALWKFISLSSCFILFYSRDSDSYRGSYFQYGGRATNHFGGLDVAPGGCHCRLPL